MFVFQEESIIFAICKKKVKNGTWIDSADKMNGY
jgi:hypothetical protein